MGQYVMGAGDVVALLGSVREQRVDVCLGGGWAVDALLGEQTRPHSDLDLWLPATDLQGLFVALTGHGVERVLPWPGDRPWNFVLHDGARRRVDLHLYEPLPDGSLHYGPVTAPVTFPAEALTGQGVIAGQSVRCESAEWAVRWHTGYPPRDIDRHDITRLCQRFGITDPHSH